MTGFCIRSVQPLRFFCRQASYFIKRTEKKEKKKEPTNLTEWTVWRMSQYILPGLNNTKACTVGPANQGGCIILRVGNLVD
jgi:hypothetical protein